MGTHEIKEARWPDAGSNDLDAIFHDLLRGVRLLEDALATGTLEKTLEDAWIRRAVGPQIEAAYRAIARKPLPRTERERRRETVYALLEQTKAELIQVERVFHASVVGGAPKTPGAPAAAETSDELPPATCFRLAEPVQVDLRLDQAISARFWGIGFTFDDPSVADRFARTIIRTAAVRLAQDLRDLTAILERIGDTPHFPPIVPKLQNRGFERLMVDILNEERLAAHLAPLAQDYSQKTDLRYESLHGLGRQRGARVQVTALTDRGLYEQKLDGIRNREHLVFLSAIELARWIDAEAHGRKLFVEPLDAALVARLWPVLGQPPTVGELTNAFGQAFRRALQRPTDDPRGPLAALPEPIRALIRDWVERCAQRSTRLLRAYEDRFGQYRPTVDGRILLRHAPRARIGDERWRSFAEAHPVGTQVRARVTGHRPAGARVVIEGGIDGFLLGACSTPIDGDLEAVIVDQSEDRRWCTLALPGVDPALVLRTARPATGHKERPARQRAAWADADARALVVGTVVRGRVSKRVPYGLFVEVAPGLDGLLHVNQMAGLSPADFEPGSTVEVLLRSVDHAQQRIELALERDRVRSSGEGAG